MQLRKIRVKMHHLMLEWMHDSDVVAKMQTDFQSKNLWKIVLLYKKSKRRKNQVFILQS